MSCVWLRKVKDDIWNWDEAEVCVGVLSEAADIFHSVAQKEWQMIPVVSSQLKPKGDTLISEGCGPTIIPLLVQKQG